MNTKTIGVAALLVLVGSLIVYNEVDLKGDISKTYYCENGIVKNCDRLSSTGNRCYVGTSYKDCSTGWIKVVDDSISNSKTSAKQYLCNTKECIAIN